MIEKLDLDCGYATVDWLPTQHGKRCGAKEIQTTVNQLVDAVNKLETMAKNTNTVLKSLVQENNIHERQIDKLQIKIEPEKCETPTKNVQDEIDKAKREGRVIFPNPADIATALTKSLRMDKEFAEAECVRLQNELERTRKALDVAVDAIKDNLSQANFTQMLDASRFHCIRTRCESALEQITALEQWEHFADTSKKIEQKDK